MRSLPNLLAALTSAVALCMGLSACPAPQTQKKPPPAPTGRTTFAFEPIDVTGATPQWGAASVGPFVAGGVDPTQAVQPSVLKITASDDGKSIAVEAQPDMTTKRMCNCALFDDNRNQLLVVGGRDANFLDNNNAEIIDLGSGQHVSIDANGAAAHPVGCQAFFSKTADKGFIFGGLDSSSGFSSDMFRYDPDQHTLTKIDVAAGPPARYDAAIHQLDNGDVLMVSGMGPSGFSAKFFQDMWLFHADSETWTEITADTADLPPGRRYAWTSLAPDESSLVFGFGSDSPSGQHMLGDFWRFTFDVDASGAKTGGTWTKQVVDGDLPKARGFTYKWQGPADSAGVLAFGIDDAMNVFDDAFVLRVPDSLAGTWH